MRSNDSKLFAAEIRKKALDMVYTAKASHIGGAFSMADIIAVMYNEILHYDSKNPGWDDRDRFLLSKGHAVSSIYACLALKGFFDIEFLEKFTVDGSLLLGHTSHYIPGIELSTGSLGHALPVGCGMSLAAKRLKKKWRVFVLIGDGDLDEGSNWESFLFAPHHKLDNLIVIVDYNKIQSLGTTKEVLDLAPLKEKFISFNWSVKEIDGHDYLQIRDSLKNVPLTKGSPTVIIANTVKGKGVDFMENQVQWHYKSPNEEQYKAALKQIVSGL